MLGNTDWHSCSNNFGKLFMSSCLCRLYSNSQNQVYVRECHCWAGTPFTPLVYAGSTSMAIARTRTSARTAVLCKTTQQNYASIMSMLFTSPVCAGFDDNSQNKATHQTNSAEQEYLSCFCSPVNTLLSLQGFTVTARTRPSTRTAVRARTIWQRYAETGRQQPKRPTLNE